MSIADELARSVPHRPTVCTIGVFDGVHVGHRALILATIDDAHRRNAASAVIVLHPHPRSVLAPGPAVPVITPIQERLTLIRECGADMAIPLTFTRELAALTPRAFSALLVEHLHMIALVVGPDFALGRDRTGSPEALAAIGRELGFDVDIISLVADTGAKVSSTAVRDALAEGDVASVARMLGRSFETNGTVVHGQARGRLLGYPTANLIPPEGVALPADGIYATRVHTDGRVYDSATYLGASPTFDGQERLVEVLLFGFDGDLYGEDLRVEWVDKVRGDRKFDSAEALQQQMARDIDRAKLALSVRL